MIYKLWTNTFSILMANCETTFDDFVIGGLAALMMSGIIAIYNASKKNKGVNEKENKVYYGVVRMILLYLVALMTSDLILMVVLGDGVGGQKYL